MRSTDTQNAPNARLEPSPCQPSTSGEGRNRPAGPVRNYTIPKKADHHVSTDPSSDDDEDDDDTDYDDDDDYGFEYDSDDGIEFVSQDDADAVAADNFAAGMTVADLAGQLLDDGGTAAAA